MKQQNYRILGDSDADYCLIQAVDEHDEQLLEKEFDAIRQRSNDKKVMLAAFLVDNRFHDLSPWKAPAAFGKTNFGDGATNTLNFVVNTFIPQCIGETHRNAVHHRRLFARRPVRPLGRYPNKAFQSLCRGLAFGLVSQLDYIRIDMPFSCRHHLSKLRK